MRIKRTTRLGKKAIVQQQLQDAIELFLRQRFVSSLTLAGAAEEILKRLLHARGLTSAVDDHVSWAHSIRQRTGKPSVTSAFLYASTYQGRNHVKHHKPTQPEIEALSPFGEAFMMLQAAVANARRLGVRASNEAEYEAWYQQAFGAQPALQADVPAAASRRQARGLS